MAACDQAAPSADGPPTGHVLTDMLSGIAVDLPLLWKGRYQLSDALPAEAQATGLERRLTLRFVQSDSGVVQAPMLVISVVQADAWNAFPADSAETRFGAVIARDATRIVAMRPAPENPLTPGTADAAGFDSLMFIVMQRPMRVSIRR